MRIDSGNYEALTKKYLPVISESQADLIEDVILGIREFIVLPDEEIAELDRKLEAHDSFNKMIFETARLNNEGIVFERNGEIEKAIEVYEEAILIGYSATHAYDRLMIIYRRLKRYDDEIRVIYRAIEVFTKENEKRFEFAINNPDNEGIKRELQAGLETCISVMGTKGFYAFAPYPVIKWSSRLTKVLKLQ